MIHHSTRTWLSLGVAAASSLLTVQTALADITFDVLAVSDDPAPDTSDVFGNFTGQAINGLGQVVISALLENGGAPAGSGVFSTGTGMLALIGRDGEPAPGTSLDFRTIAAPVLNDAGHVVFVGTLQDAGGVFAGRGIWYEAGGTLTLLARDGDAAPGSTHNFSTFGNPAQNAAGQIAFFATLQDGGGAFASRGIWFEDGDSLELIAQQGDPAPGTAFDFRSLGNPVLSGAQHIAFIGDVQDGGGLLAGRGLWMRDDLGTLSLVASDSDAAPGTSLDFRTFGNPSINNAGEIVFRADLQDGGGLLAGNGIWTDAGGSLALVAQQGDPAPGTSDDFRILANPMINTAGQICFFATLQDGGGSETGSGIWADVAGALTLIAREDDPAPGTANFFLDFATPVMNSNGDVAFFALLQDGDGLFVGRGIWLYDAASDTLIDIAIEGDSFEVAPGDFRIVTTPILAGTGTGGEDGRPSALNEDGQLVFELAFADGSEAVFLAANEVADTDGDGLTDDDEINIHGTDPDNPDTDGDGLTDGQEVLDIFCGEFNDQRPDPLNADTDGDGLDDGEEFDLGTDICNPDTDGDGLIDSIDDDPLAPGASAQVIANVTLELAQTIFDTPLGLFDGRNDRARRGKRLAMTNVVFIAYLAVDNGYGNSASQLLESVLRRVDGEPSPPDWMEDSPEKDAIAAQLATLINLIDLLE